MDFRQLRNFLALSEHRSFVRAAEEMHITQSGFSRSIQALESEFGCSLVDRGSKDLRPTPEGEVMLRYARTLVAGANHLSNEMANMTKLDAGEVRFGCGPAPAVRLVPQAVLQLARQYPKVRAKLEVNNWEQLSRSLGRDDIEFFVADIRQFEIDASVQTQKLKARPSAFFCRPDHPILTKESYSTNDIFDYPLVLTLIHPAARKMLANLSGRNDFEVRLECENAGILDQVIRQSDAIGLGTKESIHDRVCNNELIVLEPRNLESKMGLLSAHCGIVTKAGYRLSPAAKKMIATIIEVDAALDEL